MTETWEGPERRQGEIAQALSEVRGLKESVLSLAEAVGRSMGREELDRLMRHSRLLVAIHTAVMVLLFLVGLLLIKGDVGDRTAEHSSILQGQEVNRCLFLKPVVDGQSELDRLAACGLEVFPKDQVRP